LGQVTTLSSSKNSRKILSRNGPTQDRDQHQVLKINIDFFLDVDIFLELYQSLVEMEVEFEE
jgi:hypothetical protein